MSITISKLHPNQWEKYKTLRLEALKNEPTSFSSSYKENSKYEDKNWKKRLQKSWNNEGSITLFAKHGEKLIGMIGVYWKNSEKIKHIAELFGTYVTPNYRGKGVGSLLMKSIFKHLENIPQIEKLKLTVVTTNIPALKLYEKFSFKQIGRQQKELKIGDKYYDDYLMEMIL